MRSALPPRIMPGKLRCGASRGQWVRAHLGGAFGVNTARILLEQLSEPFGAQTSVLFLCGQGFHAIMQRIMIEKYEVHANGFFYG